MTSLARRFLSVWISAALTWSASTARAADPDPSSETHAQRGIELRGEGRNREALAEFEAAYALQPTARNRAQIALARQALGEWVQAEEGLEAALVEGADPWVLRYHEALERALEVVRRHLGWLDVETNASGAELFVDGTRVGALPRAEPLRLAAGSVEIEIRAPGYATLRQTSTVTANVRTRERVALLPAPVVDPGIEEPAAPATESEAPPPAEANVAVAPPAGAAGRRTAGLILLGGASLLAVGGAVAWRVRVDDINSYNSDACISLTQTRDQRCGGYVPMQAEAYAFEVGLFSLAGVAAAAGGWLVATARWRTPWRLACAPTFPAGAACAAEF